MTLPDSSLRIQMCTKTVMDTTDPDITFDNDGICNYWHEFQEFKKTQPSPETREKLLQAKIEEIKAAGKGQPYDCLIGLSGGVDSSYLAYLAKQWGLRPLAMHFDNGWNSELAVSNIESLVTKLGYNLDTFVMDWDEFRDVQRAFFKASVIDLEIPTDHMIFGALHKTAAARGIKHILAGGNYSTEWLLPKKWYYKKFDLANLKAIHNRYGDRKLKVLPALGVWHQAYYHHIKRIRSVHLLDLIDYNKADAKAYLMKELGWRDYGGKHYESIFTRFYQGYILPRKFGADKRKAHLSSLIITNQITRDEALRELQQPAYDEDLQVDDKLYVAKKLGFTADEFEAILTLQNRAHEEFSTDEAQRKLYFRIAEIWGSMRDVVRGRRK